jgi:hypothetical protein
VGIFFGTLRRESVTRENYNILNTLNKQPVLVDIGASGEPPPIWRSIAQYSVYVGFDPDQRELREISNGQFAKAIIINEAVTSEQGQNEVHFYLTRSPYCSSTLRPDTEALKNYLFSDLFVVENGVSVRATSLNAAIDRLGLDTVDWFKTDSQGTDLRLFESLRDDIRNRVLAVDIEPGLIDAYRGEDLFVNAHRKLVSQGFWLSKLDVQGVVRLRRSTLQDMVQCHPKFKDIRVDRAIRRSPGWCEARYLRTLESFNEQDVVSRDYVLLWVFAMMERQWGYAMDIAKTYEQRFGQNSVSSQLWNVPLQRIMAAQPSHLLRVSEIVKRFIPQSLTERLKQLFIG